MKRLDTEAGEKFVNVGVYGQPGTGKTSFGVTAPDPLILLSERQGMVHIREAAKRLNKPVPPVLFMNSVQDYRNVVRALHGNKAEPFRVWERVEIEKDKFERQIVYESATWPQTAVLDSLTDACRLIVEEIRMQSPPKRGKDGLPVDSQRFWQVLPDRVTNLIHGFRDAPIHTVFLCLADDREVGEEEDKRRQVTPAFPMRALPRVLAAAVNVMGFTYRREKRELGKATKLVYGILTTGPEYMMLKPMRPLRDSEIPNFAHWIQVIQGTVAPDAVEAPDPSAETTLGAKVEEEDEAPIQQEPAAPAAPAPTSKKRSGKGASANA